MDMSLALVSSWYLQLGLMIHGQSLTCHASTRKIDIMHVVEGGHQFKHKGPGRLRASHLEGWTSARVRIFITAYLRSMYDVAMS